MKKTKRNGVIIALLAVGILATVMWYFMRPVHYCEVVYKENPSTKKLEVSCDATNCDKTCYLYFRKKGSEDPWRQPNESHVYDTAQWEYKCKCQ